MASSFSPGWIRVLFATISLCTLMLFPGYAKTQIRLPALISEGMVLQRDTKTKIWGWASAREKIKIKFNGKTYRATALAGGRWSVLLSPQKAGGPYTLEISAKNHLIIHDVLVGDIWFCSGQSNMVLQMERVKEKYPEEIAAANYPQIRNFFVPVASDVAKIYDDLPGGKWVAANPQTVLDFGAASYFFALTLYKKYHVPVGIINASVGGTPIQAWISGEGLNGIAPYADRVAQFRDTAFLRGALQPARKENTTVGSAVPVDKGLSESRKWYDTSYVAKDWHPFWLPGYWGDQGVRGLNGVVWFRREFTVPASMAGKAARLFMGRIVDADFVYVNGILVGNTTYQYPPRRYGLPAGLLKPGKNLITVRVLNFSGKGGFVPDKPYYIDADSQQIDLRGDWQYKVGQVFPPPRNDEGIRFSAQNEPTGLYNTMVAPVVNYTIRGFLWYQGEANTFHPGEYKGLMKALISDWRNHWQMPALPFVYAQLPNFMEEQYSPSESQWAELREAQLETLSLPGTGMAVTIDAGEWNDIHPLNKKTVGERLALAAEKTAYGDDSIVASGPLFQSASVEGNKIILSFTGTGSGLVVRGGGDPGQFAVAGKDRKYVWAHASIDGNRVIVWADEISSPAYARYAWADNPASANLYNREGLPASPFTTDIHPEN
jgi:sialate O-acetylesterase